MCKVSIHKECKFYPTFRQKGYKCYFYSICKKTKKLVFGDEPVCKEFKPKTKAT